MAKSIEFEVKIKGGDGGVLKNIVVEASNADAAISAIVESATRASDGIRRMAESGLAFTTLNQAMGQVRDIASSLAAPYNSFEEAMARVNTMAGVNGEGLDMLTAKIQAMSEAVPLAREALGEGLYQTISAGVPEAEWLDYLNTSARSAVGGCAELGGVVKVTSGIIKAYGAGWEEAGAIQDKIQRTAKLGVTSFEELSQALPRVTGNAATLGVAVDELMAVFATTTNVTGTTAEVSTQLAAVLNALVKPTSEATAAAQAMGIQFDAASIRSAGGLENFLLGLDSAIHEYSAKTGTLSETVYGQLFGSAEALRLLGSLTGEQKDLFTANIGAMADSAGTMDEAFAQMSSTGNAQDTMLRNWVDGMTSWAGAVASSAAPYVQFIADTGGAFATGIQLVSTLRTLASAMSVAKVQAVALAVAEKAVSAASSVWHGIQAALNAVLSLNPIGIVVMAIAALVAAVVYAYNNCEEFREICDKVWAVVKDVASAVWDYLVAAFEACSAAVKKAWEWVKEFFGISSDGPTGAQTAALDRNTAATDENAEAKARAAREALAAKEAVGWETMSYEQLGKAIEAQKIKVSQLAGVNAAEAKSASDLLRRMEARYKALGKSYGLGDKTAGTEYDGKTLIANATTFKELGNNIQYYQTKLEKTAPSEKEEIARLGRLVASLRKAQEAIADMHAEASRPTEFGTLSDFASEIERLEGVRSRSSAADIPAIDARIAELKAGRRAMEEAAFQIVPVDKITTFEELDRQLAHYEALLKHTSGTAREEVQQHINALGRLKEAWNDTLAALDRPAETDTLGTLEKVEDALAYYNGRRRKASAEEQEEIAATILVLQRKADSMKRVADMADTRALTSYLEGLGDTELRMELKLMGADKVKSVISSLQSMLADTSLSDDERTALSGMIETWQSYSKAVSGTMTVTDGVKQGLGGIGDMLDTVATMTTEGTAAWLQWGAKTLDACSQAFAAIMAVTAAEAAKSVASIPVVGWIMAGAAIASVIAAFASIPKFADGGIAYGPTLGLFGEYAGASSNPEVVAPLDRLRSIIGPTGGDGGEYRTIRVEIPGRKLVAVLEKEMAYSKHR